MTARDRLRQVFRRCLEDARTEPPEIAHVAAANAVMIGDVIVNCTDEECQLRVDLLLQAAPELFPS